MKTEIGICRGCGFKKPIVNKKYYLGPECNRKRLHPNEEVDKRPLHQKTTKASYDGTRNKRFNDKFPYSTQWGFKTESEMYRWIAENRPHVSFFTGKPISGGLQPWNFLHVLPKALIGYPHYRLNPHNVVLGEVDEHHIVDNAPEVKKKALQNWKAFQIKKLQLIADYIKEFGDPKTTAQNLKHK